MFENINNEIINISPRKDYSIRKISGLICQIAGVDKKAIRYDEFKYVGVKRKILDNKKMLDILPNFKFTSIKDGLTKTILRYENKL